MGRASRRRAARRSASSRGSANQPAPQSSPPVKPGTTRVPILDALMRKVSNAPEDAGTRAVLNELVSLLPASRSATLAEPTRDVVLRYGVDIPVKDPLHRERTLGVVLLAPQFGCAPQAITDVKRLVTRARVWGYGRLEIRWLFGRSVTCGTELCSFADPVGPGTDAALDELARCSVIVAAWGDDGALLESAFWDRCWIVGSRLERLAGRQLQCIGYDECGYPASPSQLLVEYQKLQPFTVERFTFPPGLRGTDRDPTRPSSSA